MKISAIAAIAAAGLALTACSGGGSEEQPANDTVLANLPTPEDFSNVTIEAPAPEPTANVTAVEPPPVAELVPDEQTDDYAAATGMTAKVDRNQSDEAPAQ